MGNIYGQKLAISARIEKAKKKKKRELGNLEGWCCGLESLDA